MPLAQPFQALQERDAYLVFVQMRQPMVATECDEVIAAAFLIALEKFWHVRISLRTSYIPPMTIKPSRMGHPNSALRDRFLFPVR